LAELEQELSGVLTLVMRGLIIRNDGKLVAPTTIPGDIVGQKMPREL
jgi:hypothetical protein